jgi:gliding motility-associated-like protein
MARLIFFICFLIFNNNVFSQIEHSYKLITNYGNTVTWFNINTYKSIRLYDIDSHRFMMYNIRIADINNPLKHNSFTIFNKNNLSVLKSAYIKDSKYDTAPSPINILYNHAISLYAFSNFFIIGNLLGRHYANNRTSVWTKFDNNNTPVFTKRFRTFDPIDIVFKNANEFYFYGLDSSNNGFNDYRIIKMDSNLNIQKQIKLNNNVKNMYPAEDIRDSLPYMNSGGGRHKHLVLTEKYLILYWIQRDLLTLDTIKQCYVFNIFDFDLNYIKTVFTSNDSFIDPKNKFIPEDWLSKGNLFLAHKDRTAYEVAYHIPMILDGLHFKNIFNGKYMINQNGLIIDSAFTEIKAMQFTKLEEYKNIKYGKLRTYTDEIKNFENTLYFKNSNNQLRLFGNSLFKTRKNFINIYNIVFPNLYQHFYNYVLDSNLNEIVDSTYYINSIPFYNTLIDKQNHVYQVHRHYDSVSLLYPVSNTFKKTNSNQYFTVPGIKQKLCNQLIKIVSPLQEIPGYLKCETLPILPRDTLINTINTIQIVDTPYITSAPLYYMNLPDTLCRNAHFTISDTFACYPKALHFTPDSCVYNSGYNEWLLYRDTTLIAKYDSIKLNAIILGHYGDLKMVHLHHVNGCTDTFSINFRYLFNSKIPINLGNDTLISNCPFNLKLTPHNLKLYDSVLWSTGSKDTFIYVHQAGNYTITAYNQCGLSVDNINVSQFTFPITKLLDSLYFICPLTKDSIISINDSFKNYTILWSNGNDSTSSKIYDTSLFWVSVFNTCDTIIDTSKLKIIQSPYKQIFNTDSIALCQKSFPFKLTPSIADSFNYTWSIDSTQFSIDVNQYRLYKITVSDGCFNWYDSVNIIEPDTVPIPKYIDTVRGCSSNFTIHVIAPLRLELKIGNSFENVDSIEINAPGKYEYRWVDSCSNTWNKNVVYLGDTVPFMLPFRKARLCEGEFLAKIEPISNFIFEKRVNMQWEKNVPLILSEGLNVIKTTDTCGRIRLDTIIIYDSKIINPLFVLDTLVICSNKMPVKLSVKDTFKNYRWDFWGESNYYFNSTGGIQYVEVTDSCNYYIDSIFIKIDTFVKVSLLSQDTFLRCSNTNDPLIINANPSFSTYIWNNSITNSPIYKVNYPESKVILSVPTTCDILRETVKIEWIIPDTTNPKILIDSNNCDINGGVRFQLLNSASFQQYNWSDGSSLPFYVINQKDSISISTQNICYSKIWRFQGFFCPILPFGLPTAFSPNGDFRNDYFGLDGKLTDIKIIELSVYNRWGLLVYRSEEGKLPRWDGTYKNEPQATGLYFYTLKYQHIPTNQINSKTGEVNLMR